MLILGIETSGLGGGVALCRDDVCIAESALQEAPRRHAQTLVSQIEQMFKQVNVRIDELDAVAVSIGPGSFTGLRVGVVCAKTLAYVLNRPLTAVDTLHAIAENSPLDIDRVSVVSDAQRGDIFVGTYARSGSAWTCEAAPTIVAAQAWLADRRPDEVVLGPGLSRQEAALPLGCRRLPEAASIPAARVVARIGVRQIERGLLADCMTLEPFYLRRSAAEERREATR
jgi:tRNA threonylcarbamoyladenosine biosynthesis protein TsaB